jgi:hypothetical protein
MPFGVGSTPRDQQAWYFSRLVETFERRLAGSRNLPEFRAVVRELF